MLQCCVENVQDPYSGVTRPIGNFQTSRLNLFIDLVKSADKLPQIDTSMAILFYVYDVISTFGSTF